LEYIAFYNATAKPMIWKYDGNKKHDSVASNVI